MRLPKPPCLPQSGTHANVRAVDVPPALLQFAGSLAAVLALAWFARRLGLGPPPGIGNEDEARAAAEAAVPGFAPVRIALDRDGHGALMEDAQGRILLLRPHGTHFAGRLLGEQTRMRAEGDMLVVDTAERRYGAARLRIENAADWVRPAWQDNRRHA